MQLQLKALFEHHQMEAGVLREEERKILQGRNLSYLPNVCRVIIDVHNDRKVRVVSLSKPVAIVNFLAFTVHSLAVNKACGDSLHFLVYTSCIYHRAHAPLY